MAYTKVDLTKLKNIKGRITTQVTRAKSSIQGIGTLASNITPLSDWDVSSKMSSLEDANGYGYEGYSQDQLRYERKMENYNAAIEELQSLSSSYGESFGGQADDLTGAIQKVVSLIETFEEVEVETLDIDKDAQLDSEDFGDYNSMNAYERSDKDLGDNTSPSPGGCGGGGGGGAENSDWNMYTPDTDPGKSEDPTGTDESDEDTSEDTNPEEGENPTGAEQTDGDPTEDTGPQEGEKPTGAEQTDGDPTEDTGPQDGEKPTGAEQTGGGLGDDGTGSEGEKPTGAEQTGGSLVETSGSLVDGLVGGGLGDGLEMEDVSAWGAAGAGALMLGLTNLGAGEDGTNTYLSGLATGLDGDRTLGETGLDVFEHPDYTGGNPDLLSNGGWSSYDEAVAAGCTDVMTENDFLTAKANGDPSVAGYETYQDYLDAKYRDYAATHPGFGSGMGGWSSYQDAIDAGFTSLMTEQQFLNAKAAGDPSVAGYSSYQEYLDAMYQQYSNNGVDAFNLQSANALNDANSGGGTSFAAGIGALAGAAAVGGLAAGGVIGADEANGGLFGSEGGIGADGQYHESKRSVNDVLFGSLDDNDEEEKKRQLLRERIAMITTASTSLSSIVTFIMANLGTISPIWFTSSILLFALSLLYFFMVKDKKNKRREELEAMRKLTSRKGFFNQANPKTTPSANKVDWVLYGMILLSTSSFILKTYDVISWLLFLILLILFVLIIFVYVIMKKKLGENDGQVPYKK